MNWLDATNSLIELENLNTQHADRQIVPIQGTNNTILINANLLEDCDEGDYWADYGSWLKSLPPTTETPLLNPNNQQ